jgi:hypothetical protein
MRDHFRALIAVGLIGFGCEDGPDRLFTPNTNDPATLDQQNGHTTTTPWTPGGDAPYPEGGVIGGSDDLGRAQFCSEAENAQLIQEMVVKPIVPDQSLGGLPIRAPDGGPLYADTLRGEYTNGLWCDPTEYANAFTWGPTNEVIALFDESTRIVDALIATEQYLGTLEGEYTDENGAKVPVVLRPRFRAKLGDRELDQYSSRADQAARTNSWMNTKNATAIYAMLRETFFEASPLPAGFDCVQAKLCDMLYLSGSDQTPQDTAIRMDDTGVIILFSPEGQVLELYVQPVRVAPFEASANVRFGEPAAPIMEFTFNSASKPSCVISLDEQMTFGTFRQRCVDATDTRTLARAQYTTEEGRDSVAVAFAGIDLGFVRDVSTKPVFRDGEHPADDDKMYSVSFYRTLLAPIEEYKPRTIANAFRTKLQQRLLDSIDPAGPIDPASHPLVTMPIVLPFTLSNAPARLGEIAGQGEGSNLVEDIVAQVLAEYASLTAEEREVVDPRVGNPVFLLETFVDAVIEAFSHGESNGPNAVKVFRTTDDQRWAIGLANFRRGGVPYRLQVQYALNFGAVTAVILERGFNKVDEVLNAGSDLASLPYLTIDFLAQSSFGLGGDGVIVDGFDRQLKTLDITVTKPLPNNQSEQVSLTVEGDPVQDRNGYLRQIRGERYEWEPADVVRLYGKESYVTVYVDEADGLIGRVDFSTYKGPLELCPGLPLSFGDNVAEAVDTWSKSVSLADYEDCEIVFNRSINGNVLDTVASLKYRKRLTVIAGRAVAATVWR